MQNKLKHLEFLQQAITRMASNLFLLKGWTVTLISALFALAAKEAQGQFFLIAYLPALMFWVLDGYFLSQERLFRSLYDHVRKLDEAQIDFSLDTRMVKGGFSHSWVGAFFSRTLVTYYGTLVLAMFVVMLMLRQ